ncbi:MAG: ornithine cyclodeaminase family protein, partial [Acidobacteria bacterium]|nr:ornithine cyclodeaminase family protein [Acidobacteriota bacterium]
MSAAESVLFIDYATTVKLLPVPDAMAICEDVFRMHARNSVKWSVPPSQRLDVGAPFHNHWHVKTVILEDEPIAGVRLYSYYDDGLRNTVGRLDCARYIVLADPKTGQPIAILDEHWTYAIRSAAAAMVALKWLGPRTPRTLGLIGVGTMGENCLRCLRHLYRFEEIICTSRRADTREAFAAKWSKLLGIPVRPLDSIEEVVRNADIAIGGTTRTDIVSREPWVRPGATFVSLARREMDPAGWARFDKVVIDDWDCNMTVREFRDMIDAGQFDRARLHADIGEVVAGLKPGRERDDERILIHTTGMVSHDIGIAWRIYQQAVAQGLGIALPTAVAQQAFGPEGL